TAASTPTGNRDVRRRRPRRIWIAASVSITLARTPGAGENMGLRDGSDSRRSIWATRARKRRTRDDSLGLETAVLSRLSSARREIDHILRNSIIELLPRSPPLRVS